VYGEPLLMKPREATRSLLPAHSLIAVALLLVAAGIARAQDANPSMEIYGAVMLDMGHNFKTIDPDFFDTMRVSKLPSFDGQFGKNYTTFAGVRQTHFGVVASAPTSLGELKTTFEFELFGVGVDDGQTTFRLKHAYGELGRFGAGQTWSLFMDPDVFPNSIEYWGPTGMVYYSNVQFRWMPIQGDTSLSLALEQPGASGDGGKFADRIELQNIRGRFPLPDLTGQFTHGRGWGYVRVAGALRRMNWDDTLDDAFDLGGSATGWGVNLSSNINIGSEEKNVLRLQFVVGKGIENYMDDAPVDVAVALNPGDPLRPIKGEPLPVAGVVAFFDHQWSQKWSSTIGYSRTDIDNTPAQAPDAYKTGQYALVNLLYYPVTNVMLGGEFQWGRRENFSDGFHRDGVKVQFSFKYNFSFKV
jgi:hypothetical protein